MINVTVGIRPDRFAKDNSGTIEREEFLSLPQISSNPLATRFVPTAALTKPAHEITHIDAGHGLKQNDCHLR